MGLETDPQIKRLGAAIVAFLNTVARVSHVFILTSASYGFVEKCIRLSFPQLSQVFADLQVTVPVAVYLTGLDTAEKEDFKGYGILGGQFCKRLRKKWAKFPIKSPGTLLATGVRLGCRRVRGTVEERGLRAGARAVLLPADRAAVGPLLRGRRLEPELKGSIGEGSNHSNFSQQGSVKNSVKIQ